jgi:hypothetical protein
MIIAFWREDRKKAWPKNVGKITNGQTIYSVFLFSA